MKRLSLILTVLLALGFASLAQAQATRTWVSGVGDDVNPCSRTAPCKTYAGAISKTATNGIISTLDPGGFGAVTVTKGILIDGSEQIAGVLASGSSGVLVNAPTTDVVVLRGLEIHGANFTGVNGVQINQAKAVFIEHCRIQNFGANGIRALNTSNTIPVHVSNCEIRNNVTAGILSNPTGTGQVSFDVSESLIANNNASGIDVFGPSSLTLTRCVVSNNPNNVVVESTTSSGSLDSNTIINGANGVIVGSGGTPTVRLVRNLITGNSSNGIVNAGTSRCFGGNVIENNGAGNNNCSTPNILGQ